MKVEEIRPEALLQGISRLRQADLERLFAQEAEFVPVDCPACAAADKALEWVKEGFFFHRCRACETLYISPRPPFPLLMEFYAGSEVKRHWNESVYPQSEEARRRDIFAPRADLAVELGRRHGCGTGLLLDVGAGYGTFAEEVKRRGLFGAVVAVEASPAMAESCRRKGLETVEKPFEAMEPVEADLLTCFELIEHLFSPRDFLVACRRSLKPGGLLILSTPNIKGFDLEALGPISDNVAGPNHLNYFHPRSLGLLLSESGFEVLQILTPGKLDAEIVRKKALAGLLDLSAQPFLKRVLLDEWETAGAAFQDFLGAAGLSSHLWMVARHAA